MGEKKDGSQTERNLAWHFGVQLRKYYLQPVFKGHVPNKVYFFSMDHQILNTHLPVKYYVWFHAKFKFCIEKEDSSWMSSNLHSSILVLKHLCTWLKLQHLFQQLCECTMKIYCNVTMKRETFHFAFCLIYQTSIPLWW